MREVAVEDLLGPPETLGNVLVRSARDGLHPESSLQLGATAKNAFISVRMSPNRRVFTPDSVMNVLACIGSHTHRHDVAPSRLTARPAAGTPLRRDSAPIRVMKVSRPGSLSGSSRSQSSTTSSGVARRAELAARSGSLCRRGTRRARRVGWRVRSPTHRRCAEQSYQSPVRLSLRVSASSYPSSNASCEV